MSQEEQEIDDLRLSGSAEITNKIIMRYLSRIKAFARRKAKYNVEEITNIAVEHLVEAVNKFKKTKGEKNINAFIYKIVHGGILDYFKHEAIRLTKPLVVIDKSDDPEANAIRNETLANLLEKASPVQAQIIRLKLLGQSNKEIADMLGSSESYISIQLKQSKERLMNTITRGAPRAERGDE